MPGQTDSRLPPGCRCGLAYVESEPAEAPVDQRVGCPEPCPRENNSPKQQRRISDFQRRAFARCAGGP
eukprot:scaffold34827_cov27-Phaeocystis_antarctica.AAC.1